MSGSGEKSLQLWMCISDLLLRHWSWNAMISPTASSQPSLNNGGTDYVLGADIELLNEKLGAMILTIVCPE